MPDATPKPPIQIGKEPEIHVIPEQFYGVAGKAKIAKAKELKASAPSAPKPTPAAPTVPGAPASAAPITMPKRASRKWMLIPALALLFLVGLGIGTWLLLRPASPQEKEAPKTQVQVTTPEPEPEPEPTPEPEPELDPSADLDEDGLSQAEESLYGTRDDSDDSDRDGFDDLLEVVNLYNPAGFTPTRLEDAGLVVGLPETSGSQFEMLYPSSWTFRDAEGAFSVEDEDGTPVVSIEPIINQEGLSLLDWFLNENPLVPTTTIEEATTKSGAEYLTTKDGLSAFIMGDGVIFEVRLLSEDGTSPYRATWQMMVNSFSLKP